MHVLTWKANGRWRVERELRGQSLSLVFESQVGETDTDSCIQACETGEWVGLDQSTVINTAWAVMALLTAKYPDQEPIKRGCRLIMSRQQPNGEWLWESTVSLTYTSCAAFHMVLTIILAQCGIFNRSTCIDYPLFLFIWTTWALGKAAKELDWKKTE